MCEWLSDSYCAHALNLVPNYLLTVSCPSARNTARIRPVNYSNCPHNQPQTALLPFCTAVAGSAPNRGEVVMTIKLHIGANETPYPTGDKTTAEVAKILNDKYGVFDQFAADHAVEIGDMVGEAMLNAIFRM